MNTPETFICTITNDERTFSQDMELPSVMPAAELCRQVLMIISELDEDIFSRWRACCLECGGRVLAGEDTLMGAGVFDENVISVREVK